MILRSPSPMSFAITTLLLLIICLAGKTVVVRAEGSYSHTIPYGSEECLLIRMPKDQPHIISGSFDCLDTKLSSAPIRVALYNSNEERVWNSDYGDREGSFSRKGTGKHWLCLENGLTYENRHDRIEEGEKRPPRPPNNPRERVTRSVGFSLRVKKSVTDMAAEMLGDSASDDVDGTTQRLLSLTDDLNENFQVLTDHISFMKAREIVHRELHEETFTKVVRWNILEICTVVVVTFGQVLNVWWILSKRSNSYY